MGCWAGREEFWRKGELAECYVDQIASLSQAPSDQRPAATWLQPDGANTTDLEKFVDSGLQCQEVPLHTQQQQLPEAQEVDGDLRAIWARNKPFTGTRDVHYSIRLILASLSNGGADDNACGSGVRGGPRA